MEKVNLVLRISVYFILEGRSEEVREELAGFVDQDGEKPWNTIYWDQGMFGEGEGVRKNLR